MVNVLSHRQGWLLTETSNRAMVTVTLEGIYNDRFEEAR